MISAELLDRTIFMYNIFENNIMINDIIISQKESFSSDKNDKISMVYSIGKRNDTFLCLEKFNDDYKLIGYSPLSTSVLGTQLRIDFIYGVDSEIITNLLIRITNYAILNRYSNISAYVKFKHLGLFLKNNFKKHDIIFDNETGDLLSIYVVKNI